MRPWEYSLFPLCFLPLAVHTVISPTITRNILTSHHLYQLISAKDAEHIQLHKHQSAPLFLKHCRLGVRRDLRQHLVELPSSADGNWDPEKVQEFSQSRTCGKWLSSIWTQILWLQYHAPSIKFSSSTCHTMWFSRNILPCKSGFGKYFVSIHKLWWE